MNKFEFSIKAGVIYTLAFIIRRNSFYLYIVKIAAR